MTAFVCSPAEVPVSTFTLIAPALPGGRTLGKSTVVHPQPGSTELILSSAFPALRTVIERAMVRCFGCFPKFIFVVDSTSLGTAAEVADGVATAVRDAGGALEVCDAGGCTEAGCGEGWAV